MRSEDLIFRIFNIVAETAIEKNCGIELRYEKSQSDSKTLVSISKSDIDALTMVISPERSYERGCEDYRYEVGCMDLTDEDIKTDEEEEQS